MELNVEETMKRSAIHRYVDTLQTDLGATGTVRFLPEPQRSPSTSRLVSQNENRHTVARNLKPRTKRQLKLILHDYSFSRWSYFRYLIEQVDYGLTRLRSHFWPSLTQRTKRLVGLGSTNKNGAGFWINRPSTNHQPS